MLDLYGLDYTATLSRAEHIAYGTSRPILDPLVEEHARLLTSCDALILVYPTWWSTFPAILKGWFERTLVRGVAFDLDERSGRIEPLLTQIRHLVGITTHGSPRWYVRLVGDNGRRTVNRTLRASTGMRTRSTWLALYDLDGSSADRRRRFLQHIERTMAALR